MFIVVSICLLKFDEPKKSLWGYQRGFVIDSRSSYSGYALQQGISFGAHVFDRLTAERHKILQQTIKRSAMVVAGNSTGAQQLWTSQMQRDGSIDDMSWCIYIYICVYE